MEFASAAGTMDTDLLSVHYILIGKIRTGNQVVNEKSHHNSTPVLVGPSTLMVTAPNQVAAISTGAAHVIVPTQKLVVPNEIELSRQICPVPTSICTPVSVRNLAQLLKVHPDVASVE